LIYKFDSFINNRMKILLIIYKHQIKVGNISFCLLNQQEISDLVPCSKVVGNKIINELKKEGYLEMIRRKGRYVVSPKGMEIVNNLIL